MCFLFLTGEFEEESKQPSLGEQQKHQLKHRELFLSRQFESLPATHIRYVDQQVPLKIHLITHPPPLHFTIKSTTQVSSIIADHSFCVTSCSSSVD